MDVRQHKILKVLERPFVNNHSCHCEAKGPIVEKGFVAARIRAIQGTHNPTSVSSWSHSPLIPCQIYQKLEKHESCPKTQAPPWVLRRRSIQMAGSLAASLIKPFSEDYSGHASLNELDHFLSGGGIGVDPPKVEPDSQVQTSLSKHSNSHRSNQQIQQTSQQGSSNDTKTHPQEHILNSTSKPQTEHGTTPEDSDLVRLEDTAIDIGHDSTLGREGDHENQLVQPLGVTFAEELDIVLDHASQLHNSASEGYSTTHTSSSNLADVDGERKTLQGQDPYLKSSPASNRSLRLFHKRSFASPLPTTDKGSTSLEESPQIKKHSVRHKSKEQVIHGDHADDSLKIEPSDTRQVFFHSLASPKSTQRAFSLQPSTRASNDTPEPIELCSLSTGTQRSHSHHQDKSIFPIDKSANQFSDRAKPQHSITPIKSPRSSISHSPPLLHRVFSGAPEKPPQTVSGAQSPQAQRTWSWWKILPADTQSDAIEILEKGPDSFIRGRVEPDDTLPLPKGSDAEYFPTPITRDAGVSPAASELKNHGKYESDSTTPGDTLRKVKEFRTPYRAQPPLESRTFLSSASPYSDPAPPPNRRPQHPQHHLSDWVVSLPQEPMSKSSSGAASPVRRKAASSNGSSKVGSNGQKIKRVSIIVTLNGSSDVIVEASMRRKRML